MSVASLVLAAGGSARFNSAKALAPWGATTLLGHTLALAKTVSEHVLVVTGGHAALIEPHLKAIPFVFNPHWQDGMGTSIALGFQTLLTQQPDLQQILLLTVDQPLTPPAHLQALCAAAQAQGKVALTTDGINRGPPACVPDIYFTKALSLTGDHGLKAVLTPDEIIAVENAAALRDSDTPQALSILSGMGHN